MSLRMKQEICGRAGARCRVPAQQSLIWNIIFPLINNEYDLSNKILCMFKFNSSSFRKGSIWAGLDLWGAEDPSLFLNQALSEADAIDRLPFIARYCLL